MTVQITIFGLGQIGASFGLALAEHKALVTTVGFDRHAEVVRAAKKKNVVDQIKTDLKAAVRDADVVLFCLPANELRETLELVAPVLKQGAVLMDTAPAKIQMAAWTKEILPPGRYYVGISPVLNPDCLGQAGSGLEAARADLFKRGMFIISNPPGTSGEALRLAADLAKLAGASTLYADLAEADGLMAAVHVLPQLAAASLLTATVDQPGWREARKLAGSPYVEATALAGHLTDNPEALGAAAILNRENVVRMLNTYMAALIGLRDAIQAENANEVTERLGKAVKNRQTWWSQRQVGDWASTDSQSPELPTLGEHMQQMFLGSRKKPGEKK
jgi:prephenate dehydrogenase